MNLVPNTLIRFG